MQDTPSSNSGLQLQPQGSTNVQSGQGSLQPQTSNGSAAQSQSTGQPQQDVLGAQDYKAFDGLKVEGAVPTSGQQVTSGKGSYEVFIIIIILLLVAAAFIFKRYRRTVTTNSELVAINELIIVDVEPESQKTISTVEKVIKKKNKKPAGKNKVIKKSKSKAKKKK